MPEASNDMRMLKYYYMCLLHEASKFLIMLFIFSCFHAGTEYLVAALTLCMLRHNMGGIHFKQYWSCFGFSLVFLAGVIAMAEFCPVNLLVQVITTILCIASTFLIGPVQSSTRPAIDKKHFMRYRNNACIIMAVFMVLFICMKSFTYRNLIYWVIVFQTLQLIAAKIYERRKKDETLQ